MNQNEIEKFFQWLDEKLSPYNMKYHQLAKKAGISHSVFTKAKAGHLPKWDACMAIAKVLDIDPVEVFRAASLLSELPPQDAEFEQMRFEFYKIGPSLRRDAIRILHALGEVDE